jgi:activator of HSP90 ATPase
MGTAIDRRRFALRCGVLVGGLSAATIARAASPQDAPSLNGEREISRDNAAIHQDVAFAATPARVYQALTVAEQFDKVVTLSAAMNSAMKAMLGSAPTQIDASVGGSFSLFGGYVTGRFLELVPDTRIVQAWRSGSWPPGYYSIASFALFAEGNNTKLNFDHRGFPNQEADHLAEGWHVNYWQPLAKALI